MWQSHRQTQLMIVKKDPKTKSKRDVVFTILTKCFIPTPHQVTHNQWKIYVQRLHVIGLPVIIDLDIGVQVN